MGTKLQVRVLHNLAAQDAFDGVGRIFLQEAEQATHQAWDAETILALWQEYYPKETAVQQQDNLVLVYFDGRKFKPTPKSTLALAKGSGPIFSADKSNEFKAEPPVVYEKAYFPAENPEDRIIL